MPSTKRRSRHGQNSTSSASTLNNIKANGIIYTTNNLNNTNHHLNAIASTNKIGNGITVSGGSTSQLTLKQQQQLDRNAYLSTLTKYQLQIECRKRGQKTTGTKAELLTRLGSKMVKTVQNNGGLQKAPNVVNGIAKNNPKDREMERAERERLVLWLHPVKTVKYSTLEAIVLLRTYGKKCLENKLLITVLFGLIAALSTFYHIPGNHQTLITSIRANLWFAVYWVGLGVLSSVGLGTGLHTFLLYLGPHIASVTLAAYECNSLNFPQPPYPDEIICPEEVTSHYVPSLWSIMSKVRLEAFLWGAGTALGELPPYFMAKASRLSGYDPDDADDLKDFEELNKKKEMGVELSWLERAKIFMERVVERVGFFGILACASIPNPLFDLAGITCGHFLVPFWTFFGATLIGKAVIKMHIQKVFVIIAFNETLVEKAVDLLAKLPWFGKRLQAPFQSFLVNQKNRLHRSAKAPPNESKNFLAKLFEYFVILMIVYFVISIVNSLAQSYHKRLHKKRNAKKVK